MMSDSRAFDGWRRLGRAVMVDVAHDDPAGLAQVRAELDMMEAMYREAVADMAGARGVPMAGRPYSHGEIAKGLGVTRQAVSKLIKSVITPHNGFAQAMHRDA